MNDLFLNIILFVYNTIGYHNLGLSILEISIFLRAAFYPVIKQQLRYSKKMNELQPQLSALKEKHKGNQQAFASAQMELFKQHGVNPAAGCLPGIVQIVVLFGLFGALNKTWNMHLYTHFLIWDMSKPDILPLAGLPLGLKGLPGILVIMAAITQFIQTKMMMPTPPKIRKEDKPAEKEEKSDFMAEFAEAQSSMIWMFPLMFLFLGTQWPSGLALYWSTSSLIAIFQQYKISGLGGISDYVLKLRQITKR